ncbi:GspH/FimT family protein [Sphaerotilus montanus]|jgi:type IV fimbrial biogenesis protein FimT|uniref:Type II secretion system protein H n=1 Tax=Sphaerotilus montanus TaxID=522889 RepID=A0A7Y9QZC3_9BURK|nr:GspH/FimT family protein [Sphaerotilus montanus]NYG34330.1 type IV fimbrial biogenesis protein FimT [Sphaerotilus montanus]NZD57849.1 GspH/FimT family protein [Sphaerotilus montanus]
MVRTTRQTGRHATRADGGLTLVELLVVLAVAAVLLQAATLSFAAWLQRQHLLGVSAQFNADLQSLRAAAVTRHRILRLSFQDTPAGMCYLLHSGDVDACRCAADPQSEPQVRCMAGTELLRAALVPVSRRIRLQSNVASLRIDPRHGTVTPTGSIDVTTTDGSSALRHVVNILGRVRTCAPGPRFTGYSAC